MMVPLAGIFQTLANLFSIAIVLGFIAYGFIHGMFRSVLVGMQALVAFVVTLTFIPTLTEILISIDMPPSYAFPVALFILAIGTAVGIHMLIEKYIPSESISILSVIDKIGGAFIGGATGYVAAGGVLVALSLVPLPESYRLNHSDLQFDFGARMLRTFARIIEPDGDKRNRLLEGDDWPTVGNDNGIPQYPEKPLPPESTNLPAGQSPLPFDPLPPNIYSEPFVDLNKNEQRDQNESFLDITGDKQFTEKALEIPPVVGLSGDDAPKRFVGLIERYQESNWWRWRVNQVTWEDLYPVENPEGTPLDSEETPGNPVE
ncbi:MAG: CvpA family protein [Pirellulales bacterium]|nr:CvpA family protein [Pirellulales bacterium]